MNPTFPASGSGVRAGNLSVRDRGFKNPGTEGELGAEDVDRLQQLKSKRYKNQEPFRFKETIFAIVCKRWEPKYRLRYDTGGGINEMGPSKQVEQVVRPLV